jgi:hypothetical protein
MGVQRQSCLWRRCVGQVARRAPGARLRAGPGGPGGPGEADHARARALPHARNFGWGRGWGRRCSKNYGFREFWKYLRLCWLAVSQDDCGVRGIRGGRPRHWGRAGRRETVSASMRARARTWRDSVYEHALTLANVSWASRGFAWARWGNGNGKGIGREGGRMKSREREREIER